jgi:hypothetical protein
MYLPLLSWVGQTGYGLFVDREINKWRKWRRECSGVGSLEDELQINDEDEDEDEY